MSVICSVSQEPYIIWLSFMVHMCKKLISWDGVFIFFKILIFSVVRGRKVQKNGPKWQKILSVMLHIWGTIHHMTVIYDCKMINNIFRYFFENFDNLGPQWGGSKRAKNDPEWQKIMSVAPHISATIHPGIFSSNFLLLVNGSENSILNWVFKTQSLHRLFFKNMIYQNLWIYEITKPIISAYKFLGTLFGPIHSVFHYCGSLGLAWLSLGG